MDMIAPCRPKPDKSCFCNGTLGTVQSYGMSMFANNDRLQFRRKIPFDDLKGVGCMLHCPIW